MGERRNLLAALRDADALLARAEPPPRAKHRLMAAVDRADARPRRAHVWAAPALAMTAAAVLVATSEPRPTPARDAVALERALSVAEPHAEPAPAEADAGLPETAQRTRAERLRSAREQRSWSPPSSRWSIAPAPAPPLRPEERSPAHASPSPPRSAAPMRSAWIAPGPTRPEAPAPHGLPPAWSAPAVPASPKPPAQRTLDAQNHRDARAPDEPPHGRAAPPPESDAPEAQEDHVPDPHAPQAPLPQETSDIELHVLGIYEAGGGDAPGPVSVHIDRPGTHVIVLSAYAATTWEVTASPEADLLRLIVTGYEVQRVALAPPGVTAEIVDLETTGQFFGCGYEWPDQDPSSGCETPALLSALQAFVGRSITSFHGCYAGTSFLVQRDGSAAGVCDTGAGYSFSGFP